MTLWISWLIKRQLKESEGAEVLEEIITAEMIQTYL